ncbi:MAG TPA: cation diffusion facilitator family transporter, partial [Acidimicrobiia bacterium]|nr:cation diffusion facilitator family transporter [Acidimicrobiia bacterium]
MSKSARLGVVLGLNLSLIAALVIVGVAAHSLGVIAEGIDYLADAAAIVISLIAIRLARIPPTPRHPRGYPKATMIAALVNAGWLLALAILVAAGSMRRLVAGAGHVHGLAVLIISSVAALVMLLGAFILRGDGDDTDLNMRAVLLDTAADAAAAAGVAIVGAIIYIAQGAYWLDPLAALAI